MLIGLTLAIMLIITLISIIGGNSFIGTISENLVDTEAIVNGTTTTFDIVLDDVNFGLDPITGGIALIIALSVVGALIGIQFVGSGLNDSSVRIIMLAIFYGGLWAILSLLAYNLIVAIEVFGGMIYLVLTILYAVGVVQLYFGGVSE